MAHEREARYFHSAVYAFNGQAVEAVLATFRKIVSSTAVKCYYERDEGRLGLEGFDLTCPQHLGPEASEALGEAICEYIKAEEETVADEERGATLERFPESLIDDFGLETLHDSTSDAEELADEDAAAVCAATPQNIADSGFQHGRILHSVSTDCSKSTLKLFSLRDIGPGMLERTLVHSGPKVREMVYLGFTCRAARWDTNEGLYAFNGRSGRPIEQAGEGMDAGFARDCSFVALAGSSKRTIQPHIPDSNEVPAVKHWKFAGEAPTIAQFLEHMGETEFLDPEAAPNIQELPSDARKYNEAPEHQTRVYGRSRVLASEQTKYDDNSSSSEGDDDSDESSSDEGCETSDAAPILSRLRVTTVEQPEDDSAEVRAPAIARPINGQQSVEDSAPTSTRGEHRPAHDSQMPISRDTALSADGRVSAKVDKKGLMGNAGVQAQWEHRYPEPSARKLNRHGISRRAATQIYDSSSYNTSNSSTTMSLSSGLDVGTRPTASPTSSFSIMPPLAMLDDSCDGGPENQLWAQRSHGIVVQTGNLIDIGDSSAPDPRFSRSRGVDGRVRAPPGLGEAANGMTASSIKPAPKPDLPVNKQNTGVCGNLIELLEPGKSASLSPRPQISFDDVPLVPSVRRPDSGHGDGRRDEDEIVERLQDETGQQRPVRYTMRQRAAKKKKKPESASKTTKQKAQLPQLSPPPPPKRKTAATSSEDSRQTQRDSASKDDKASRTAPAAEESHIEKLIGQVTALCGAESVQLRVTFGTIMVRPMSAGFCKANWSPPTLQRGLQREEDAGNLKTTFFERLTSSATDAAFMLDLLPGDPTEPIVEYEITVRLPQGAIRAITFEQQTPDSFKVHRLEQAAVTLYMHYPIHVHDARSQVISTECAADIAAEEVASFIQSCSSVGNAPSFVAMVPVQSFHVESVHVKRIFTRCVNEGVHLKVEEIQDLQIEAIETDKQFNLKATALDRVSMIDDHRLWYESSLSLAPLDRVQAGVLQALVDHMVAAIDGVGYHNVGPYVKTEIEEVPEPEIGLW